MYKNETAIINPIAADLYRTTIILKLTNDINGYDGFKVITKIVANKSSALQVEVFQLKDGVWHTSFHFKTVVCDGFDNSETLQRITDELKKVINCIWEDIKMRIGKEA